MDREMETTVLQWIEVDVAEVIHASGKFHRDGQDIEWETYKQEVYLFSKGKRYPDTTLVQLDMKQAPYPKGKYIFGPVLESDRRGIRAKKYIPLIPLEATAKKET